MATKVDDKIILKGKDRLAKYLVDADNRFGELNAKARRAIIRQLKKDNYVFTKAVESVIDTQYKLLNKRIDSTAALLEKQLFDVGHDTIKKSAAALQIKLGDKALNFITRNVKTDIFSNNLHSANAEIRKNVRRELKKGLKRGESVEKIASRLLKTDDLTVKIPKHIQDITKAARRAAGDSAQRKELLKTIDKYKNQIKDLKSGSLGVKTATNKFVKDIKDANLDNIDAIVKQWAEGKATYMQTRVARTEGQRVFSDIHRQNAIESPYIIGIEIRLAHVHDYDGICDDFAGIYLFEEYDISDIPKIPFHPNCICSEFNIYDTESAKDFITDEELNEQFEEAA
jgi:hypothetical protein